jgi:dTDP-4-dehydrorhamnose 3,5-epimerase
MQSPQIISGDSFFDERGQLDFFNSFDMKDIVRFYKTAPLGVGHIRAWQGHVKECKWFYCVKGKFEINLVEVDDFNEPSELLKPKEFLLEASKPSVLFIPEGFANGFQSLEDGSELMIFSNFSLSESNADSIRFKSEMWEFETNE